MSTELTVADKKAQQLQWLQERGLTNEMWSSLQNSIYPGAKPESILMAVNYCKARGLDPLKKPVHIVPLYVKDARTGISSNRDVIMPGIYELRTTAARTGQYVGMDEAVFGPMIDFKGVSAPAFCSITVYRMVGGLKCAFTHTEYFEEAVSTKKEGGPNAMWTKRPRGQLAKCAEAGALRKAFPDELGGIHSSEEAIEYDAAIIEKPVGGSSVVDLEAEILGETVVDAQVEYITESQTNELINLVIDTDTVESEFCSELKVAAIELIAADKFDYAKSILIKKLPQKAEQ